MKINIFYIMKNKKNVILTLLFIVFPILISFAFVSLSFGNTTNINSKKHLDISTPNIYFHQKIGEYFCSEEIEYIEKMNQQNITPIYFSSPNNIEVTTKKYAPFFYKISTPSKVILNKQIDNDEIHNLGYSSINYSSVTYGPEDEPTDDQIIKSFSNNDGIYISESFLYNNHINLDSIDENSIIEFNVHVPIYSGATNTQVIYHDLESIVHSVNLKKKIKGVIKDNLDLQTITNADNIVLFSLEECNNLINKFSNIAIDQNIRDNYQLSSYIPSAFSYLSSYQTIQSEFNNLSKNTTQYFESINLANHFQLDSVFYEKTVLSEKISSIRSILSNISLGILVVFTIVLLYLIKKTYPFIKNDAYIKTLQERNLSLISIKNYLKLEKKCLLCFFALFYFSTIIIYTLFLKLYFFNIQTDLTLVIIFGILCILLISNNLRIRLKKQLNIIDMLEKTNN
ncbi:MAG: hypothetical protein RR500_01210 [Bacilli bacterium]